MGALLAGYMVSGKNFIQKPALIQIFSDSLIIGEKHFFCFELAAFIYIGKLITGLDPLWKDFKESIKTNNIHSFRKNLKQPNQYYQSKMIAL